MAEQGNAYAQDNLGVMYEYGQGVPQDYAEAVKWFRKAAEQGYAPSQFKLGYKYEKGPRDSANHSEAVKWYRERQSGAMNRPDVTWYHVRKGPKCSARLREAAKWHLMGAEQGI